MRYVFLIASSPTQTSAVYSALQLGRQLLVDGQQIPLCFFYGDGVFIASNHPEYPDEEYSVQRDFLNFSVEGKVRLFICQSSMRRRSLSIAEDIPEKELDEACSNVAFGKFWYSTLFAFARASHAADRVLQF